MKGQASSVGRPVETQFVMDLQRQFVEVVPACLAGERRLRDVFLWLASHVQAIADARNEALEALTDDAWLLIAEHDDGFRDEESVRTELSDLIGPLEPHVGTYNTGTIVRTASERDK